MSGMVARLVEGPDDFRAVFDDIYERGWTDGLPVIPPKQEYVAEMLAFNGLQPDEVIAEIAPAGAPATVQKIAINAVMAGCRNEYLPVLIAAVRAMAEPRFNLLLVQATTSSVTPCLIVNGPIRHALDLNCGRGALGPGRRANATIGRALRLIMLNIGGGKPGDIDKAQFGQPGKYTFCFGELEEESPWNPMHVDAGFERTQSTVTVCGVEGTVSVRTPYGQPESILMVVANALSVYESNTYHDGTGNPGILFTPGYAKLFHETGWSKARIKHWLFEATKVPLSMLPRETSQARHRRPRIVDGRLCLCEKPDDIIIVVAGSPEAYHVTCLHGSGAACMVTKPIDMAGQRRIEP